jgi:hypothetical protein
MSLRDFAVALRYRFAKDAPRLSAVVRDGDAAMAAYLLTRHPEDQNEVALGHGLVYAIEKAGAGSEEWLRVVRLIRGHENAAAIVDCLVGSALGAAARKMNVDMARELLSFPQVAALKAHEWDQILFECLPQGDPEKKRIETRNFEDRDGHPEILAMVRAAMGRQVELAAVAPGPVIR